MQFVHCIRAYCPRILLQVNASLRRANDASYIISMGRREVSKSGVKSAIFMARSFTRLRLDHRILLVWKTAANRPRSSFKRVAARSPGGAKSMRALDTDRALHTRILPS